MALVVFLLRIAIGGVFLVAGAIKAHEGPNAFAAAIAAYRLLTPDLIRPLAIVLPYLEIGLGGYLAVGLFTRIVAAVATLQLLIFSAAIASLLVRHISADCGCFGSGAPEPATWTRVGFDVLLAGATALIALRPPGILALDTRLAAGAQDDEREA